MSSTSEKDVHKNEVRISRTSTAKKLMWRVEHLSHLALEGLIGRLPAAWAYQLGEWVAGKLWHLMPLRRITVINNLRIALGDTHSLEEIEVMAEESFRRVGGNLLSAARTARLKPEQLDEVLKIDNPELIRQAVEEGKGVVLILAHMGNWELLSRMIHFFPPGTSAGAVYRMLNNPIMDQQVLKRREADGTRMFSKRDQFHQIAGFVRDGGVLGVLADQRVGHGGELTPYFGRLTRVTPFPRLLARRTGCRVMALSVTNDGPGQWRARYIPVENPTQITQCTAALEQSIRSGPLDVFWLQQRWKLHIKTGRNSLQSWLSNKAPRTEKPHRILLWLDDLPEDWTLGPEWIHPDVDFELAMHPGCSAPTGLPHMVQVHNIPEDLRAESLIQWLHAIDRRDMRPLDAVMGMSAPASLERVCKHLSMECVDLAVPLSPVTKK